MDYGLIGEKLPHSFSKEIHEKLGYYQYSLKELKTEELRDFVLQKNYKALNVTIPYKQDVMPLLDEIDPDARAIGAVNTIVNRDGVLCGYNTDFGGMKALIEHAGVVIKYKKVLILGTGGTSLTAHAVCERLGAKEIWRVSRRESEGAITYDTAYADHSDADVIINATPCGMFPGIFGCPIALERFKKLSGVIDVIYNPLQTELILSARERGIDCEGGLYMLVAQAVLAAEKFLDRELDVIKLTNKIYEEIYFDKRNIVLSGMPASGKSTVGKLVARQLGRELIDTDRLIVEREGDIPTIFREKGEPYFRELEGAVIREVSALSGKVISLGGGAVLRADNVRALQHNGAIFFIDRSPEYLIPTGDRPLADKKEKIMRLYKKRIDTYLHTADFIIDGDCEPADVADSIMNGE
ncbi:shikimate kinase [Ruminococcus sp.]|uniref:shikimate kinase n=1 Tax=Ruminococcus sp. TaxID=41978 RepID=UPI00389063D6